MAKYMTQKMSSGTLKAVTYYRKQSSHPSHNESGQFTNDAMEHYANENDIATNEVDKGTYRSDQGIPTGGSTCEI